MALATFPFSPLYAQMTREKHWNDQQNIYDSGDIQGFSNWMRPLYQYTMPISLFLDTKQQSLWRFWDQQKGTVTPFLIKDPYDNAVNSVLAVRSGITNAATLYLFDINSYFVRADTATVGSLFSVLSGYVRNGVEYSYAQDTGLLTVNTKVSNDTWGVRSMSYWKKVKFSSQYVETAIIWNMFTTQITMMEMP